MKLLLTIALLLITLDSKAESRGEISFDFHHFVKSKSQQNGQLISTRVNLQDTLNLSVGRLELGVVAKANQKVKDNSYFNINDLYYTREVFNEISFSIGYKIHNWTKMESLKSTDVVNSVFIDGDLENFDKKGEFTIELEKEFAIGNLKFFIFPRFEENFFPAATSRLADGVYPKKHLVVTSDGVQDDQYFMQMGISFEKQIEDLDFLIFALKHIDRSRTLLGYNKFSPNLGFGNLPMEELTAYYFEVFDLGLSATYFLDEHTLKLEALSSNYLNNNEVFLTSTGLRKFSDFISLSLGHEYSHSWEMGWESVFFLEYQRIFDINRTTRQELSVFQNDIFIGHRINLNDFYSKEITLGVFLDLERSSEWIFDFKYSQRLNSVWRGEGGFRAYGHSQRDNLGIFSLSGDNEIYLSLTRFF